MKIEKDKDGHVFRVFVEIEDIERLIPSGSKLHLCDGVTFEFDLDWILISYEVKGDWPYSMDMGYLSLHPDVCVLAGDARAWGKVQLFLFIRKDF